MTEKQLRRIVAVWQERLGLERWKIDLDLVKPAGADNFAETVRSGSYDSATIRVERAWRKWTPENAEATLVHELLHVLHRDTDQAFYEVEEQLHRDAWSMVDRRYNHAMEGFIDKLAWRLVELSCA